MRAFVGGAGVTDHGAEGAGQDDVAACAGGPGVNNDHYDE